ncbi:MAG: DNA adenine methylase [Phycisphaerales bacterium JB038]
MIKYLGSKRLLLPAIVEIVGLFEGVRTVADLFSGTARVGHALKRAGYRVLANDHNAYAHTLARCYVQADLEEVEREARLLLEEFNRLPGRAGYFTDTFCVRSRYLQPKNGERVDAIREAIAAKGLPPVLEAVLLVSLMEAADRVDSTTGVQMAYLKQWAPRSHKDLHLRLPNLLPRAAAGKGEAHDLEAVDAAATLEADLAYIDPPYNQHSSLGTYHVWESLIRWDKPPVYGVACKRVDCRQRKSAFNSKRNIHQAMRRLIEAVRAEVLVVSFSNEGYISREEMERYLGARGEVYVFEHDYKRYVGAQIGIHNPSGARVGKVSHLRNKEYLYVVAPETALRATPHLRSSATQFSSAERRRATPATAVPS